MITASYSMTSANIFSDGLMKDWKKIQKERKHR